MLTASDDDPKVGLRWNTSSCLQLSGGLHTLSTHSHTPSIRERRAERVLLESDPSDVRHAHARVCMGVSCPRSFRRDEGAAAARSPVGGHNDGDLEGFPGCRDGVV